MGTRDRFVIGAWLIALGYLGLYAFGLFMGAFSPGEMLVFTVAAAVVVVAFAIHSVRTRRQTARHGEPHDAADRDAAARELHRQRESRCF
jgi:uncharacterized membrane protein